MKVETPDLKYKSDSHGVYACEYHIIWHTKYRQSVLSPDMQNRIKQLVCEAEEKYGYTVRGLNVYQTIFTC